MMTKSANQMPNFQSVVSRRMMIITSVSLILIMVGLIVCFFVLHPLPPRSLSMACGPKGSSYYIFGKRYQRLLAKQGIDLKLVETAGGVENLNKLRDPKSGIDIGFVEGGIATEDDDQYLMSLGTVSYEPMWCFTRKASSDRLLSLKGKKVSVGPEGSDSRAIMDEILKRNHFDNNLFQKLSLDPEDAAKALMNGQIDAAVLVMAWDSPVVRHLIRAKGIHLVSFSRADAYVALFPSLSKLILPEGVGDLVNDRPPHDTVLLSTKVSLIARHDLNPAIQYLLLETASEAHSRPEIFQAAGEFPAPEAHEIPLSADARHYYKSGRPFLQRYLPFWLAALVEQTVVLLIPVLGLMYPLVKSLMALYSWSNQRKIFLIYGELHWLEDQLDKLEGQPPTVEMMTRMKNIEHRTRRLRVTANLIPMVYSLKETIQFVRERLNEQGKIA